MAYPADLVGKYVQGPVENRAYTGTALTSRQSAITTDLTRVLTRMVFPSPPRSGAPMPVQRGPAALTSQPAFRGQPWVYTLLEYVPGLVTVTKAETASGVLTGWMSGCYLFRFTVGNTQYVAHIGTDVASEEKSEKAKEIWFKYVKDSGAKDIFGCNPARDLPITTAMAVQAANLVPQVAGYYEPNGAGRILVFGMRQHDTSANVYMKLVAIDPMPLRDWDVIRKETLFASYQAV